MNYIVFDIETQNIFQDVGSNQPEDLDISVVSVYDSSSNKISSFTIPEFSTMWPLFEKADFIVGYNSDHFDIPILNKYYAGNLKDIKSIDLLAEIKKSYGKRPKLDDVAFATLGKNKISHGLQAVEWWKTGEIEKIKKYCEEDVLITKDIFEFALNKKYLKIKEKSSNKIIEIPVDSSHWTIKSDEPKITRSLF